MSQADIGRALDTLADDVKRHVIDLVGQYRDADTVGTLKQAIDTPHRARAQIAAWIAGYDARNGAATATTFLNDCLAAAGSAKTLPDVNAELAALEAQAQTLVDNVNGGWTWEQAADAIEAQLAPDPEDVFDYSRLEIPDGYITVWGDPY